VRRAGAIIIAIARSLIDFARFAIAALRVPQRFFAGHLD
jgi:hypothetical protein